MAKLAKGAVALVTGGTSGIGLALVEALHTRGLSVRFCARDAKAVSELERRLPGSRGYVCDVTKPQALADMAAAIGAADGRLDLLVANVGRLHEPDFTKAPVEEADICREIELNLTAPVLTVNRFLPLLRTSKDPHIVMVGSGFGWSPSRRAPLYSAAKAGIRSFVKSLRAQLAPAGVHVMEVVPPTVDTPAVAHLAGPKLPSAVVARITIEGLEARRDAVFPGHACAIPIMLRIAPSVVERATLAR